MANIHIARGPWHIHCTDSTVDKITSITVRPATVDMQSIQGTSCCVFNSRSEKQHPNQLRSTGCFMIAQGNITARGKARRQHQAYIVMGNTQPARKKALQFDDVALPRLVASQAAEVPQTQNKIIKLCQLSLPKLWKSMLIGRMPLLLPGKIAAHFNREI